MNWLLQLAESKIFMLSLIRFISIMKRKIIVRVIIIIVKVVIIIVSVTVIVIRTIITILAIVLIVMPKQKITGTKSIIIIGIIIGVGRERFGYQETIISNNNNYCYHSI